jgi:hypothetical protein
MPKMEMQNSLLNSYFVANLKLCFNIVRGHDEKTATKLPFKLMAISNSSSLKQPAILKHENAMRSLSNNAGGPRITHVSKLSLAFHRPFLYCRRPDEIKLWCIRNKQWQTNRGKIVFLLVKVFLGPKPTQNFCILWD